MHVDRQRNKVSEYTARTAIIMLAFKSKHQRLALSRAFPNTCTCNLQNKALEL